MSNLISFRLSERQLQLLSQHREGGESLSQTAKRLLIETLEESDLPYRDVLKILLENVQTINQNTLTMAERLDIVAENQVAIRHGRHAPRIAESMPHKPSHNKKGLG